MKNKIYPFLLLLTVIGLPLVSWSQRNIDDEFYAQNLNYYNPSFSILSRDTMNYINAYDTHTMLRIAPNNTKQVVSPELAYLAFSKINNFTFIYNINYQHLSYTSQNEIGLGAIYSLKIKQQHQINFGLRANFGFYNLKRFNKMDYATDVKRKNLKVLADLDFGIDYVYKGLDIGISGKNLLASKYKPDEILFQNQHGLYANVSYNFDIKNKVEIKPTIFMMPLDYTNLFISLEVGLFKQFYVQYAFRLNQLRSQYNAEYHLKLRSSNEILIGLAFNHSMIYTDFNAGLRLGYIIRN